MHLAPHESDKLMLVTVGLLAQRRLARGLRLNYPEAIGLISFVVLELIRDGKHSVAELMQLGGKLLGKREVLPGVAEMMEEVLVEGTFPDGTKLVAIQTPITAEQGNVELALYGSGLNVPAAFSGDDSLITVGATICADGDIVLNEGRETVTISVTNTDNRPIQIGSHFNFVECNPRMKFDRELAYGKRLDIPAGTSIRFEPGQTRELTLVEISGNKIVLGGNNLSDGQINEENKTRMLARVSERAFGNN